MSITRIVAILAVAALAAPAALAGGPEAEVRIIGTGGGDGGACASGVCVTDDGTPGGRHVRVFTTGPADSGVQGSNVIITGPGYAGYGYGFPGSVAVETLPPPPSGGPGTVYMLNPRVEQRPVRMVKAAYLGVAISPVPEILAEQLSLPRGTALVVDFVAEDSPAAKAGLRKNDVLTKIDDQVLVNPPQLATLVRTHKAGEKVTLTVIREARPQPIVVELVEKEMPALDEEQAMFTRAFPPPHGGPRNMGEARGRFNIEVGAPAGATAAVASTTITDGEHTLTVTQVDNERHLVAKDKDGAVIFDGPITTDEQLQAVPTAIRKKLNMIQTSVQVEAQAAPLPPAPPAPPVKRMPAPPKAPPAPQPKGETL